MPLLVVEAIGAGDPIDDYADALWRTERALAGLRFPAEVRGLRVALRAPLAGFLASPVEAAELIDRVNSPLIGLALDAAALPARHSIGAWLDELGARAFIQIVAGAGALPENAAALPAARGLRR